MFEKIRGVTPLPTQVGFLVSIVSASLGFILTINIDIVFLIIATIVLLLFFYYFSFYKMSSYGRFLIIVYTLCGHIPILLLEHLI